MSERNLGDFAEVWGVLGLAAGKHIGKITKQPRSAEASPTDNHAVASGLAHHSKRVVCLPNIAVSKAWD